GLLHHQDHGAGRRTGLVRRSPWDRECLMRPERYPLILELDHQLAFEHEEELIFVIVLVPVEVTLDDAQPDNRLVHLGERFVEPRGVGGGFGVHVDLRELLVLRLEVDVVALIHSVSLSTDGVAADVWRPSSRSHFVKRGQRGAIGAISSRFRQSSRAGANASTTTAPPGPTRTSCGTPEGMHHVAPGAR